MSLDGLELIAIVFAAGAWVIKKLRAQWSASMLAERGEPEFERAYEPIEVFARRTHPRR